MYFKFPSTKKRIKFLVGLFMRWQKLAPRAWNSVLIKLQVTRKAVSFEWDKEKHPAKARLRSGDTTYWSVQEGSVVMCCVWQNEFMAKANRRSLWRSLVSWNKATWSLPLEKYMAVCKTEKETLGNFISRKKKVKGNRFILPFDKNNNYKNYIKTFFKPNLKRISLSSVLSCNFSKGNILSMCFIHLPIDLSTNLYFHQFLLWFISW